MQEYGYPATRVSTEQCFLQYCKIHVWFDRRDYGIQANGWRQGITQLCKAVMPRGLDKTLASTDIESLSFMNTQNSTICCHTEARNTSLVPYPVLVDPLAHAPPSKDSAESNQSRPASLPNAIQPRLIMKTELLVIRGKSRSAKL
jgi:hypothetical protein